MVSETSTTPALDGYVALAAAWAWEQAARALAASLAIYPHNGLGESRKAVERASSQLNMLVRDVGGRHFLPSGTFNRFYLDPQQLPSSLTVLTRALDLHIVPGTLASVLRFCGQHVAAATVEEHYALQRPVSRTPPDRFVCYSSADAALARLVALSIDRYLSPWLDQWSLPIGSRPLEPPQIDEFIDQALRTVNRLYICYSYEWITQAGYAHREILQILKGHTQGRQVDLVVVRTDDCPIIQALCGHAVVELEDLVIHGDLVGRRAVTADTMPYSVSLAVATTHPRTEKLDRSILLPSLRVAPGWQRLLIAAVSHYESHAFQETADALSPILDSPLARRHHPCMSLDFHRATVISALTLAIQAHAQQALQGGLDNLQVHISRVWALLDELLMLDPVTRGGPAGARLDADEVAATNQHYLDLVNFLVNTFCKHWTFSMTKAMADKGKLSGEADDQNPVDRAVRERLRQKAKEMGDILLSLRLIEREGQSRQPL